MVYFDKPYAKIEIEPAKGTLILTWHGFANSDEYRETCNTVLLLLRQFGITKWLSNMKEMKAIRQADQEWSVKDWFPQVKPLNIQKMAIVISDDIFNQMAMSSMMSKVRAQLTFPLEYFQDVNAAKNWLEHT